MGTRVQPQWRNWTRAIPRRKRKSKARSLQASLKAQLRIEVLQRHGPTQTPRGVWLCPPLIHCRLHRPAQAKGHLWGEAIAVLLKLGSEESLRERSNRVKVQGPQRTITFHLHPLYSIQIMTPPTRTRPTVTPPQSRSPSPSSSGSAIPS